jgi:hypothetical protein
MVVRVNADNVVRAETHRMFADIQRAAGERKTPRRRWL